MDPIKLTQQLVQIPSYVNNQTNEAKIGQFIFNYLKQYPWLKVQKQYVTGDRFNIIAQDTDKPRLLIVGHMDTVQPKSTNCFSGKIKNYKIYGLGSSDMKSSLAALLNSLSDFKQTKGLMLLFYIDEEYDFLGMKKFVKEYKEQIRPKLILGEGNDLKVKNGCRGLIELKIIVKGKTGHAANPSSGQNAIGATFKAYQKLELWLKKQNTTFQSSLNMAYIRGGLDLSKNNKDLVVGKEGNNIADIAKIIIDIRPGSDQVEAKLIVEVFEQFIKKQNCQIKSIAIRHNLSGWYTDKKELTKVLKTIGKTVPIRYDNPNKQGYVDIQMLDQAFSCPCLGFGPGEINQAHQRDENVAIKSIIKASQIYQNIIQAYCS